jgi:acyl carrier protein
MTTLETLQDILVSEYKVDPAQLTPESELSAIGLDSLSVVELLFKIEDAFQLTIVDDAPTNLKTVGDVVEYIDGLLALKRAPASEIPAQTGA